MPKKLRITAVPSGPAPLAIRQEWVGIDIPIDDRAIDRFQALRGKCSRGPTSGYHLVTLVDAVLALREAGRPIAASYWMGVPEDVLRFRRSVAKVVEA